MADFIFPNAPTALADFTLPRRRHVMRSPEDWRNEILYFLLIDRFSDGQEGTKPLLNRSHRELHRASPPNWTFECWARSGRERWQGGTLAGVKSKLAYLQNLGITTIWLSPVFKQRAHLDTYHGYGIQNYLDVDGHFGTRQDLVELIRDAHDRGMRVILDIVFNHSGSNWNYPLDTPGGPQTPVYTTGRYSFGEWLGADGRPIPHIASPEDGVWPRELQDSDLYTRAGTGDISGNDIDDPLAIHKRSDFFDFRDFDTQNRKTLQFLIACYEYWIALSDCDGFRIDALKHVSVEASAAFCNAIKEYANLIGKSNFLLVGEIAGGDNNVARYLDLKQRNLDAALDIGEMKLRLEYVAKGLIAPRYYFDGFSPAHTLGSHRSMGNRQVTLLEDHDGTARFGRFSVGASSEVQVAAGAALQLFTLGIPCIYYGMEQAFGGPEPSVLSQVPEWGTGKSEWFLREAMFGPEHPRPRAALGNALSALDASMPGFGAFGTSGAHCFDETHPAYRRIQHMSLVRKRYPVLRYGRQYLRPIAQGMAAFRPADGGELVAWSRILHDQEAVCVLNSHGYERRGGRILVGAELNPEGSSLIVVLDTAACDGRRSILTDVVTVQYEAGCAFIVIEGIDPSEFVILLNQADD